MRRVADDDLAHLVSRMVWIVKYPGRWIQENRYSFVEENSVLPVIRRILPRVPLEVHSIQYIRVNLSKELSPLQLLLSNATEFRVCETDREAAVLILRKS